MGFDLITKFSKQMLFKNPVVALILGQDGTDYAIPKISPSTGRLEVDTVSSGLPAGAATEATLAAIDAGVPAALGQGTMAASMPVVIASDQAPTAVKVDQTTPGTTNAVAVTTLPALEQTTPAHYNVALTLAATEYSQALPANCRAFRFQCRTAFDVRYAFVTGKVATPVEPYFTLKSGVICIEKDVKLAAATLYLASATAAVVVEIEAWA